MDLSSYRAEFPTLGRKTYLNTCSLGAISRRSVEAAERFQGLWEEHGASAWYELWIGEIDRLRKQYAKVIGARPDEVAWVPNVSVGLSSVASCLDHVARPEVVLSEMEFPTVAYQWLVKPGVKVRWVKSPDGVRVPVPAYAAQITERTALAAASRVFYTSGFLQDVKALAAAAHRQGALCLIDDYQATGLVPIDVHEAGIDILVGGSLKWLLGGIGSCFLYVRRDLLDKLNPTITGWWGNAHMFEFDATRFAFWKDARKFETGEINMPSVYYANAGMEIVHEITPARLRAATAELVTDLIERAQDAKFTVRTPEKPDERAGIVMIELREPDRAVAHLAKRDIIVDYRPGRLRISPYFYNLAEENERIVDALVEGGFG